MEELLNRYKEWLLAKGVSKNAVGSMIARLRRVGKAYDLLNEYAIDRCAGLIDLFTYTRADVKEGREPAADIVVDGDYITGLASLKSAIVSFATFLSEIRYTAPSKYSHARFCGSFDDFKRYVGPKCRNEVNVFCSADRKARDGICEYCGEKATLQSAHIVERPVIMHDILEKYYKKATDDYDVDLSEFFDLFKKAHMPIKEHIFFLCHKCHNALDKTKTITVADIRAKRGS